MALRTARRRALHNFIDFSGGVHLEAADYLLDAKYARDLLNLEPEGNAWKRRRSHRNVASLSTFLNPAYVVSLGFFDGSSSYIIVIGSLNGTAMNIRRLVPATGAAANINSGGAVTLNTVDSYSFVMATASGGQGPLFATTFNGPLFHWTGSGDIAAWTASAGTLPKARMAIVHANRVWMANGVEGANNHFNRVWWSSLTSTGDLDPRNWSTVAPNDSGSVDFGLNNSVGGEVTALSTVGPYVLVFKRTETHVIYDVNTGANRQISDRIGCGNWRAVTPSPYGTFFLSDQGVFVTDGSSVSKISDVVEPIAAGLNPAYDDDVHSMAFYQDSLYVALGSGGGYLAQYHVPTKTWWLHGFTDTVAEGMRVGFVRWGEFYGIPSVGMLDDDRLFQLFDADAADDNCAWSWTGPWHSLGNPNVDKTVHELRLDADGAMTVALARFPTDTLTAETEIAWETAGIATTQRRFYTPGTGRLWAVKLSGTASDPDVRLGGYSIDATQRAS